MKKIVILSICIGLAVGFLGYVFFSARNADEGEMRGIWLAYVDYKELGLYNQSEEDFRDHADQFLEKAKKEYRINTVFFHVRSFDDATWKSKTFKMSPHLWDKKTPIPYDPLAIMVELAHEKDMELHGWMNPYRISQDMILDPGQEGTDKRILTAVGEVLTGYKVDGIHFDDYFYHNQMRGGKSADQVEVSVKKKHVNDLVAKVYDRVKKEDPSTQFGISPQGNIENCRVIGADVDTWMKEAGYVDYIAPQIYWTDEHSAVWRERMYSDTLAEWKQHNTGGAKLYVGLAAYCSGIASAEDPGWKNRSDNLAFQVRTLREEGCDGYILFSAKDLYRDAAGAELNNLKKVQ